mmetsp:Transcript_36137/g.106749  ORF Transcript_36137/g.106749 Transcript_36137/m.106749 type:complete len:228 (+) Transcript_36137:716-1399(+)
MCTSTAWRCPVGGQRGCWIMASECGSDLRQPFFPNASTQHDQPTARPMLTVEIGFFTKPMVDVNAMPSLSNDRISPSWRVVPLELMSISIGSVAPCFSRYSSSATISSVTAGTSGIPRYTMRLSKSMDGRSGGGGLRRSYLAARACTDCRTRPWLARPSAGRSATARYSLEGLVEFIMMPLPPTARLQQPRTPLVINPSPTRVNSPNNAAEPPEKEPHSAPGAMELS